MQIKSVFENYQPIAEDFEAQQLTSGHINQTYLVKNQGTAYVLQRINTSIFKNLEGIMHNIQSVSEHLKARNYPYQIMTPLQFQDGKILSDEQWRLFPFFENTQTFEKVESATQAYEAAKFLSEFYGYINDIEVEQIGDSIPGFIDFDSRYTQFQDSLKSASDERLKHAEQEINWVEEHKDILKRWKELLPQMPERVIHADPKISNFLFDENSSKEISALIDWDTFMCGPILYDFGDMVRSYTNLKEEDDPALGNNFSAENYAALKEGFLAHIKSDLEPVELDNLDLAAKVVVYIQAIRFLTDYLNNDAYYATHRPHHNLDRTQNQLNLLKEILNYLA